MLWGLICFVHPSQPLEEDNNFEIWGARGIKLSRVWIICPSTVSKQNKSLRQYISYHSPKWSHWITHFGGIQRTFLHHQAFGGLGETSEVRNLHRRAAGFPEANLVRMGWLKCRVDGWWVRIWLTCWSFLVLRSHKSGRMVWVIAHMPYMGVVYSPIHEWWIFMIN